MTPLTEIVVQSHKFSEHHIRTTNNSNERSNLCKTTRGCHKFQISIKSIHSQLRSFNFFFFCFTYFALGESVPTSQFHVCIYTWNAFSATFDRTELHCGCFHMRFSSFYAPLNNFFLCGVAGK